MNRCPNCKAPVDADAKFCKYCAADLSQAQESIPVWNTGAAPAQPCSSCGVAPSPGDRFCTNCSAPTAANSSVGNVPYPSARKSNRMPITVLVVLLIAGGGTAAFLLTKSLESQLVGTWSTDTMGKGLGISGSRPIATAETWKFFSDNTGRMEHFTSSGSFKYTILDDGRIKIEFQGGQKAEGKLDGGNLILAAFGEKPVVLYKW